MADPISPTGSLGQTPIAASASSPPAALPAQDLGRKATRAESGASTSDKLSSTSVILEAKSLVSPGGEAKEGATSLEDSVKAFREFLKNLPSDLQLQPDKDSGMVVYKLVNPVTQEVIRQFPSEEIVAMARKLRAMESQAQTKSGIFLDQKT